MSMFLDCTFRDGGYYNAWDFSPELCSQYFSAMEGAGVEAVELGFRTLSTQGFKGPFAYTTDGFLNSLNIPVGLTVGVMVNANELVGQVCQDEVLSRLFPNPADKTPADLVRIACHVHEVNDALPAVHWLKKRGFQVGLNLMQVSDRTQEEIRKIGRQAQAYPVDVLYFADSMGSMDPEKTAQIIRWFRSEWTGAMGVHTHDNMGLALTNALRALDEGVTWVDSTVTGMGRGPGNARTEALAIEIAERRGEPTNLVQLMSLIREQFKPMREQYGWGTNPYYYLAGKYGIHPTYIQEMLNDSRYSEEDVLAVIEHLRVEGGKKFRVETLDTARHFYRGEPEGRWSPCERFATRDVLLLGTGPGVARHRSALERFIGERQPLVLALNTQSAIDADFIDLRVACHPVRLLADCEAHTRLRQPLITPYSQLPSDVQGALKDKQVLDFGLSVEPDSFLFNETHCTIPTLLVVGYALAAATSGKADRILMAGFDGYGADDPRSQEMQQLLEQYQAASEALPITAITPTRYGLHTESVYAL